jgi:thiamine-monophosphate kinase
VAVTVLGACAGPVVRRGGAGVGDVVAVVGRLGWAEAGLSVLSRGFRSPRAVVEAHRRPQPPYAEGAVAAVAGATAMIDVSDGLLADLGHLAAASQVAIDLRSDSFVVPEPLQAVGAALGIDPMRLILQGGEDHALAATFPADAPLPEGWQPVGSVSAGEGVTVDGATFEGDGGHRHYR